MENEFLSAELDKDTKEEFDKYLEQDYIYEKNTLPENCKSNCAPIRYTSEHVHYVMYTQCTNLDYLKRMRRKDKMLFLKQIKQASML